MNRLRYIRRGRLLAAITLLSLVLVIAPAVLANTRYDDGDVPF
jgi:hypothetical protein